MDGFRATLLAVVRPTVTFFAQCFFGFQDK